MVLNIFFLNKPRCKLAVCGAVSVKAVFLLLSLFFVSGCAPNPIIDQALYGRASNGDVQAQYEIGEVYYHARYAAFGRSFYWDDAARWYLMAANQGDARAHYRMSQYYFNKKSDYAQSFRWLELPAQQGVAEAQHSLGMHYAQGWGTRQDLILAYKWILLAFEGGIHNPNGRVVSLRSIVERGGMSQTQIEEGERLARIHVERYGRSIPLDPGRRTLLEMR